MQNELIVSGLNEASNEIYISDVTGRGKIMKLEKHNHKSLRVDVSELTPGFYFGRINAGTTSYQIKFVKK